jgi:hypothetical protein
VITKKGEAVVARRISGPRLSSSSRLSSSAREVATSEREVVVYQRRSAEEREPAAERNKLHRLAREMDAATGLEQLGHSMVYVLANRHVMYELPSLVQTKHPRVYGYSAFEDARYPGALLFNRYCIPRKEESMIAGVMLCKMKKGIQGFAKKVANDI